MTIAQRFRQRHHFTSILPQMVTTDSSNPAKRFLAAAANVACIPLFLAGSACVLGIVILMRIAGR